MRRVSIIPRPVRLMPDKPPSSYVGAPQRNSLLAFIVGCLDGMGIWGRAPPEAIVIDASQSLSARREGGPLIT